jgi:putative toxin-antitoxin system antitoxin component (TIGR02293 family)
MINLVQTFEGPAPLQRRLRSKVDGVTAAFDRAVARHSAMRDRLAGLDAEVLLAAIDCLGSAERAADWLTGPELALDGEVPLDVAGTDAGKDRVLHLLRRLDLGMFAADA